MSLSHRLMALAAVLCASCSDGSGLRAPIPGDGDQGPASSGGGSFLSLVEQAPFQNAFRGTRRGELRYDPASPVIYREDVGADGLGKFAVDPIEVTSADNQVVLESLLAIRQIFHYRFRDWRIKDYVLFLQNYTWQVLDGDFIIAGVSCMRVEVVRPHTSPPSHYLVDIDPLTGMVLAWKECDDLANVVAMAEFETFQYGGDVSGLMLVDRFFTGTTIHPIDGDLEGIFGFVPVIPTMMPTPGVTLSQDVEKMNVYGEIWAKVSMTDGLETTVFLSRAPEGSAKVQPSTVTTLSLGTWTGIEGKIGNQPVRVAGKFSPTLLELTLESAF